MISAETCVQVGTCFVGHTGRVKTLATTNWNECQMRCESQFQCQAWTYIEGSSQCRLIYMALVKSFGEEGCISGNKACNQGSIGSINPPVKSIKSNKGQLLAIYS